MYGLLDEDVDFFIAKIGGDFDLLRYSLRWKNRFKDKKKSASTTSLNA